MPDKVPSISRCLWWSRTFFSRFLQNARRSHARVGALACVSRVGVRVGARVGVRVGVWVSVGVRVRVGVRVGVGVGRRPLAIWQKKAQKHKKTALKPLQSEKYLVLYLVRLVGQKKPVKAPLSYFWLSMCRHVAAVWARESETTGVGRS